MNHFHHTLDSSDWHLFFYIAKFKIKYFIGDEMRIISCNLTSAMKTNENFWERCSKASYVQKEHDRVLFFSSTFIRADLLEITIHFHCKS